MCTRAVGPVAAEGEEMPDGEPGVVVVVVEAVAEAVVRETLRKGREVG